MAYGEEFNSEKLPIVKLIQWMDINGIYRGSIEKITPSLSIKIQL